LNRIDILVFSPHPDDAELGCAGTILLSADRGLEVAIADLSDGEKASRGNPDKRNSEREQAARLMGISERYRLGLPDTLIGTDHSHRLPVIELIRAVRPRIVLAPYCQDKHPDHAAGGRLVKEAVFLAGVATVGAGTVFRPERLFYYMIHQPFNPSFAIDITSVWEKKKTVLDVYESQFTFNGEGEKTELCRPDFMSFIEARARYFGAMIGAVYAEAFFSEGPVGLEELPGIGNRSGPVRNIPGYNLFV
jgi:bacillithiol biosynthesis deacetylase BshB1